MKKNIAEKILSSHDVGGAGAGEIALKIDQTLTQDATGTMAYLQLEALGIDRVKTDLSVAYIDHNTLQGDFKNADDHEYIRTVAKKYGVVYSRPGNGICHQLHLERFAKPGGTLIGSDSHTPTAGGLGCLGFGAGGLDVALAMAGKPYNIPTPKVVLVNLTGELKIGVSAKDVILKLLSILSVKGGVGRIIEYGGEGVAGLSVPQRATITNMGAELGATTSVFPSDERTKEFLTSFGREEDYAPLTADEGAEYEKVVDIDMSTLEPLAACPHSPDNVKPVSELSDIVVSQVCVGSCTNSSLADLTALARILDGKTLPEHVSLSVSPGSRTVLQELTKSGALAKLLAAGARLLECTCGPCIGMGFSPKGAGVSLRTFNRNFLGRSGTKDADVYLVSPETAAASALAGKITSAKASDFGEEITLPNTYEINDNMFIMPAPVGEDIEIVRGKNIQPLPVCPPMPDSLALPISLKVGDDITTDHIMPAGAEVLPFRSNVPYLSRYCFRVCDEAFPERAKSHGNSCIVGGGNYGQGSSREHAALVPLYLGVRAVIAKSFARIHTANLINNGILPLTFKNEDDYNALTEGEVLTLTNIHTGLVSGEITATVGDKNITLVCVLSERGREIILKGGVLRA